ncbi:potassium transporter TrkA [Salinadaptatus halalkaliphilus]|uniref:Potassium transporter TrkA n=1 Tax=Salinadaptatus halalkaliphilus TaxID=2419781 RepID=A0A4V3VLM2_9EURY|nr:potassium transporter TrkA [Salinadaptatus halalkaliphilus]THE66227.1 potassium transporter TrkA [Salinadaptatus halalkaliphilus]
MTLPVEVLLGLYIGLLTGIVPAFVAGSLGFLVRYFTGVTLPGFGVLVLALSIASIQGGLLGLAEPSIAHSPRLLVAVLVVLMLALYAHNRGDKLGAELPHRLSLTTLRQRTLSADVVELVGSVGQVTVRSTGDVRDVEGYPPLPASLRETLENGSWRLPADLPLSELETRLEERLRTDYGLADVAVTIDDRGRATIEAAPPSGSLSKRVRTGRRAVTVQTLVPTGLAPGDELTIRTGDRSLSATVLGARTEVDDEHAAEPQLEDPSTDESAVTDGGSNPDRTARTATTAATGGGRGRVTVAVARRDVKPLLETTSPRLVVQSRGTSREFEALAVVTHEGYSIRRLTVGSADGIDIDDPDGPEPAADITILAIRRQGTETAAQRHGWVFAPGIDRSLEAGDEIFVAGPDPALETFAEAVAR